MIGLPSNTFIFRSRMPGGGDLATSVHFAMFVNDLAPV